jgi:hypothetical protein
VELKKILPVFGFIIFLFYIGVIFLLILFVPFITFFENKIIYYSTFLIISVLFSFISKLFFSQDEQILNKIWLILLSFNLVISLGLGINSLSFHVINKLNSQIEQLNTQPIVGTGLMPLFPNMGSPVILYFIIFFSFNILYFVYFIKKRNYSYLFYNLIPIVIYLFLNFILFFVANQVVGSVN